VRSNAGGGFVLAALEEPTPPAATSILAPRIAVVDYVPTIVVISHFGHTWFVGIPCGHAGARGLLTRRRLGDVEPRGLLEGQ
jgi:hypothetical protein